MDLRLKIQNSAVLFSDIPQKMIVEKDKKQVQQKSYSAALAFIIPDYITVIVLLNLKPDLYFSCRMLPCRY